MPDLNDTKQEAGTVSNSSSTDLLVDLYFSNNDYSIREAISVACDDMFSEASVATHAGLYLLSGLTKDQALREVDNLRWLVEQRYDRHE